MKNGLYKWFSTPFPIPYLEIKTDSYEILSLKTKNHYGCLNFQVSIILGSGLKIKRWAFLIAFHNEMAFTSSHQFSCSLLIWANVQESCSSSQSMRIKIHWCVILSKKSITLFRTYVGHIHLDNIIDLDWSPFAKI